MLYREIMAVCSEMHTKHTNTLCGQNVEFLFIKLVVHIVFLSVKFPIRLCALTSKQKLAAFEHMKHKPV